MAKEKDKIYCHKCGKSNDVTNDKCVKCDADLNEEDETFFEWLCDFKYSDVRDNFFKYMLDFVQNFFKLHFYGITLSISVALAVIATIINGQSVNKIENTTNDYRISDVGEVVVIEDTPVVESVSKDNQLKLTCPNGYTLNGSKCIKKEEVSALENRSCPDGYYLSGTECYNDDTEKITITYCPTNDQEYQEATGHTDYEGTFIGGMIDETSQSKWYFPFKESEYGKCHIMICTSLFSDGSCTHGSGSQSEPFEKSYCPSGTTEVNGKCRKTTASTVSYSCDSDYEITSDNKCVKTLEKEPTEK